MANIKQQIKRNKTNEKRRLQNASFKSSVKTAYKQVEKLVAEGNKAEALEALNFAYKKLDKALAKGIIKLDSLNYLFLYINCWFGQWSI